MFKAPPFSLSLLQQLINVLLFITIALDGDKLIIAEVYGVCEVSFLFYKFLNTELFIITASSVLE